MHVHYDGDYVYVHIRYVNFCAWLKTAIHTVEILNLLTLLLQGILLVYDITNEKSFDNIRNWIRNIEEVKIHVGL